MFSDVNKFFAIQNSFHNLSHFFNLYTGLLTANNSAKVIRIVLIFPNSNLTQIDITNISELICSFHLACSIINTLPCRFVYRESTYSRRLQNATDWKCVHVYHMCIACVSIWRCVNLKKSKPNWKSKSKYNETNRRNFNINCHFNLFIYYMVV